MIEGVLIAGMVLAAGATWLVALKPLIGRWNRHRTRVRVEDVLKVVLTQAEGGHPSTLRSIAGALGRGERSTLRLMVRIERAGLIQSRHGGFVLTASGTRRAMHVLRAHRLMERFLVDEAQLSAGRVHAIAHGAEHDFDEDELRALDEHLGLPRVDPHGDVIPRAGALDVPHHPTPMTDWPLRRPAVVVHVEDEPAAAMKRLVAAGLRPGIRLTVESRDQRTVAFRIESGRRQRLSPAVAANVHLRAAGFADAPASRSMRLSRLPIDQPGTITTLCEECSGLTRRRLLDLGITPQARITPELTNLGGAARAYRIRNTLIALRKAQADQVMVEPRSPDPRTGGDEP